MSKLVELLSGFFGINDEEVDETQNNTDESTAVQSTTAEESKAEEKIELSTVIDFVRELEAFYTSDIFKLNSDYISNTDLSADETAFIKKKAAEYQSAVNSIELIKDQLLREDSKFKEMLGKSNYSFYDSLVSEERESTYENAFSIVSRLISVNVNPNLDRIIEERLRQYMLSWKIEGKLPVNMSLRLLDRKANVETYQIGKITKQIILPDREVELLPEQLEAIDQIAIKQIPFSNPANTIWVRITPVQRKHLDYLKKSTIFPSVYSTEETGICYDAIEPECLEVYLRAMFRLLLSREEFMVISIINPNNEMCQLIKGITIDENRVTINDKASFLMKERTGEFKDNLQFGLVSKKQNLKKVEFQSYTEFISYFIQ